MPGRFSGDHAWPVLGVHRGAANPQVPWRDLAGFRNVVAVLAALRLFQRLGNGAGEHFADVARLSDDEIDALCERINFGE
jgi:hypothetical protein